MDKDKIQDWINENREYHNLSNINLDKIEVEVMGTEPPIEPPGFDPVIPDMCWAQLGFVPWFMRIAWDPETQGAAFAELEKTLTEVRRLRFASIDSILCARDGSFSNAYMIPYQPWEEKNGKADFNTWNSRWWWLYNYYCRQLVKFGLEPSDKIMSKYLKYYFQDGNNVNGVKGRFSPETLKVMIKLWRRLIIVHNKYWPLGSQWMSYDNELNHLMYGKNIRYEVGFMIAKWYKDHYLGVMDKLPGDYDVTRVVCNQTFSSFPSANFTEEHEAFGYNWGDNRCLRDDKRVVVLEENGKSTIHNFAKSENGILIKPLEPLDGFLIWLKNGRWQGKIRFHEDGGAGWWTDDSGKKHLYGKGYAVGNFRVADVPQTYEAWKFAWQMAKEFDKTVVACYFPLDALKRVKVGNRFRYEEDCRVGSLDWERPAMVLKAYLEVYGD